MLWVSPIFRLQQLILIPEINHKHFNSSRMYETDDSNIKNVHFVGGMYFIKYFSVKKFHQTEKFY